MWLYQEQKLALQRVREDPTSLENAHNLFFVPLTITAGLILGTIYAVGH
jgi:hypothetical protein